MVLPLGRIRERESLKDVEDEAEVPGTPAVLLLWSHGRYYRCGAVLPLVAPQRYYRWVRGTTAWTQTGQGREERTLQWNGKARRVRS